MKTINKGTSSHVASASKTEPNNVPIHRSGKRLLVAAVMAGLLSGAVSAADLAAPQKGTQDSAVRSSYGQPNKILGPVGNPPISRWVYDDFTVFFEGRYVIHSVVHSKPVAQPSTEAPPAAVATPVNETAVLEAQSAADTIEETTEPASESAAEPEYQFDPVTGSIIASGEDTSTASEAGVEDTAEVPIATDTADDAANQVHTTLDTPAAEEAALPTDESIETSDIAVDESANTAADLEAAVEESAAEVPASEALPANAADEEPEYQFDPVTGTISVVGSSDTAETPSPAENATENPYAAFEQEIVIEGIEDNVAGETMQDDVVVDETPAGFELPTDDTLEASDSTETTVEAATESDDGAAGDAAASDGPQFRFDPTTGEIVIVE